MTCPHCSAQLVDDARFCPACGHSTVPTEAHPQATPGEPDLVGRVIGGRFRVLAKLGEGGMGSVYRGEQTSLHRPCAIKLLKPELSANQMLLRRFNAEAAAVAKLSHPNTVNIYDFGQDTDGTLFIAMELIDGHSLRKVVGTEAPLTLRRALGIAGQIAASLADAHAHDIVHRDLKPDNVMVQDRGRQKDVVRVLDFGIAKLRDDSRATAAAMTQAGDMLGTPQYMAPEQIKGEAVDGRADIYALGCILYELVTARQPFEATTVMAMLSKHLLEAPIAPSVRRPDLGIPPEIDRLVLSAMQKDPKARPASMEMYGEQIAALAATMPAERSGATGGPATAAQPVPSPSTGLGYGTPAGQRLTPAGPASTPQAPSFAASPTPPPPSGFVQAQPGFTPQAQPGFTPQAQPGFAPPGQPGFTPAGQPGFYRSPQGYPQPGYPQRPAMAMTAPQRPRSHRSMSIILVCVAAVVIAGGTVALGLAMQSKPGPGSGSSVDPPQSPAQPEQPNENDHDQPDQPAPAPATPPTNDPWGAANANAPAEPAPAEPAPSEAPAQGEHAHSCEEVVRHYSDLMAGELKQQLAKMDTSQLAPYRQQIEAQLTQTLQSLLTSCQTGDWSDHTRDCILHAHHLQETARCM